MSAILFPQRKEERDNSQSSYRTWIVHILRPKSRRSFPSRVIFEKQSFALKLSFHSLLGSRFDINNGCFKTLGLSCIPLISGSWNYRVSASAGRNFLGETRKLASALNRKIRKAPISVDKTRKPKTKLGKSRKPYKTPKPKNRSFIGRVMVFA